MAHFVTFENLVRIVGLFAFNEVLESVVGRYIRISEITMLSKTFRHHRKVVSLKF